MSTRADRKQGNAITLCLLLEQVKNPTHPLYVPPWIYGPVGRCPGMFFNQCKNQPVPINEDLDPDTQLKNPERYAEIHANGLCIQCCNSSNPTNRCPCSTCIEAFRTEICLGTIDEMCPGLKEEIWRTEIPHWKKNCGICCGSFNSCTCICQTCNGVVKDFPCWGTELFECVWFQGEGIRKSYDRAQPNGICSRCKSYWEKISAWKKNKTRL